MANFDTSSLRLEFYLCSGCKFSGDKDLCVPKLKRLNVLKKNFKDKLNLSKYINKI